MSWFELMTRVGREGERWSVNAGLGWRYMWRCWPPLVFVTGLLVPEVVRMAVYVSLAWLAAGVEAARWAAVGATILCLGFPCVGMVADFPSEDVIHGMTLARRRVGAVLVRDLMARCPVLLLQSALVALTVCLVLLPVTGARGDIGTWLACSWMLLPCQVGCLALGLCVVAPVAGTRWESSSYNLAVPVLTVLSGAVLDLDLPGPAAALGGLLPMTHGVAALRAGLAGRPFADQVGLECLVALGWVLAAVAVYTVVESRSRAGGRGLLRAV